MNRHDERTTPVGALLSKGVETERAVRSEDRTPEPSLGEWIQAYWFFRWSLPDGVSIPVDVVPNNCPSIVFQNENKESGDRSKIIGPRRAFYRYCIDGTGGMIGIRFEPGGLFDFTQRPLSEIVDSVDRIESLFGESATDLVERLLLTSDIEAQVELLNQALLERAPARMSAEARRAKELYRTIETDVSVARVSDLVEQSRMSERTMQRLFDRYIGCSPKQVIRVVRFQEVLKLLRSGTAIDWAACAARLGYFDQAHFINDFKAITGTTPGDFALKTQG